MSFCCETFTDFYKVNIQITFILLVLFEDLFFVLKLRMRFEEETGELNSLEHRTYVWGGAIKIGSRPFWGRGVFVLVISNINIGYQKSLTTPFNKLLRNIYFYLSIVTVLHCITLILQSFDHKTKHLNVL